MNMCQQLVKDELLVYILIVLHTNHIQLVWYNRNICLLDCKVLFFHSKLLFVNPSLYLLDFVEEATQLLK